MSTTNDMSVDNSWSSIKPQKASTLQVEPPKWMPDSKSMHSHVAKITDPPVIKHITPIKTPVIEDDDEDYEGWDRSAAKSVWQKPVKDTLTIEKPKEKKAKDDSKKFKSADKGQAQKKKECLIF